MLKKIFFFCLFTSAFISHSQFSEENYISTDMPYRIDDVKFTDFDGDNFIDIISASQDQLVWYKNLGNDEFSAPFHISSENIGATSIHLVDIDGDSDFDIVSCGSNSKIYWYENQNSAATWIEHTISDTLPYSYDIHSSDLDGDSDFDIVLVTLKNSGGRVIWFENDGTGTFTLGSVLSTNVSSGRNVFSDDIDGDGDIDVLVAATGENHLIKFENLGLGSFGAKTNLFIGTPAYYAVRTIDFNGDGDNDIISASTGGGLQLSKNVNNTSYETIALPSVINTLGFIFCKFGADMDNDSDLDLILGHSVNSPFQGAIHWIENVGDTVYNDNLNLIDNNGGLEAYPVDLNNDGNIDIISTNSDASILHWVKNLGNGQFSERKSITTDGYFEKVTTIHDLDLDGNLDIIFCSVHSREIRWYQNDGNGNYNYGNKLNITVPRPTRILFGKVDNDQYEDLLLISSSGLFWAKSQGNGDFDTLTLISTNLYKQLDLKDLNNDGKNDLILRVDSDVSIMFNIGQGLFGSEISAPYNIVGLIFDVLDVDSDGDLDIATSSKSHWGGIAWWENNGNGEFNTANLLPNQSAGTDFKFADIDGDGDQDVVVISSPYNRVIWFNNLGSAGFSSAIQLDPNSTFSEPTHLTVRDFDGDGDPDVCVVGKGKRVVWYENLGGFFSPEKTFAPPNTFSNIMRWVSAADIDQDGDLEIVVTNNLGRVYQFENYGSNTITIEGSIYADMNQNDIFDSTETGFINSPIMSNPTSDFTYSFNNGAYFMAFSDTNGVYNIYPDSIPYWNISTDSASFTVLVDTSQVSFQNLDFGFFPDTVVNSVVCDLTGGQSRCNSLSNYWINISNTGTTISSGTICLELDPNIVYSSCINTPDSIIGQKIYWSYDSLNFFQNESFACVVVMPNFTFINSVVSSLLTVKTDSVGVTPYETDDMLSQLITCAYDPNDKIGYNEGIDSMGYITTNVDTITYTIRFQNTGNDTAYNVLISDILDPGLDWHTFELISSSHNAQVVVDATGEVDFNFNNIFLPDSAADFLGSQGFIKYRIQMVDSLQVGTSIYNTAYIYFDQNPAVITNTEIHTTYDCENMINSIRYPTLHCMDGGNFNADFSSNPSNASYFWKITGVDSSYSNHFATQIDSVGSFDLYASVSTSFCSSDTTFSFSSIFVDSVFIDTISVCSGASVLISGRYLSEQGLHYFSQQSQLVFCDSVTFYYLQVLPNYHYFDTITICHGYSYSVGASVYQQAGNTIDTLTNFEGCDSIIHLNLSITPQNFSDTVVSLCANKYYHQGSSLYNTPGMYSDTLQATDGCDSILQVNLTILPVPFTDTIIFICQGETYQQGTSTYGISGTYVDTLVASNNCDSIAQVLLIVYPNITVDTTIHICQNEYYQLGSILYNSSGLYTDTLVSLLGCDSIVNLELIVDSIYSTTINESICPNEIFIVGTSIYSSAGNYIDTLQSQFGCDSIVFLSLNVYMADMSTSYTGSSITVNQTQAQYQWLNCPEYTIIPGAIDSFLILTDNGSYAVEVSSNGCIDTSSCIIISDLSVKNENATGIIIFPNPFSDVITIFNNDLEMLNVELYNIQGKLIKELTNVNDKIIKLPADETSKGLYILVIQSSKINRSYRILKK